MAREELMKFEPKRQGIILIVSAVIIWIGSFLFLLWFFSNLPYVYGSKYDLFPFMVNFSALLATLICIQTWLVGFLDYIERFARKRNLVRHLKKLEKHRLGTKK